MKRVFTSTGMKLIHHPEVIEKIKKNQAAPVSLQVGPTSRCNLNCSFCSNAKRTSHEDLDPKQLVEVMTRLRNRGLKTVEWTGGGDPTMYKDINYVMESAHAIGLQQGMITNGVFLKKKVVAKNLNRLAWLRISMNCLDYVSDVDIPKIKGVLGFSYVMNEKTDVLVLSNNKIYGDKIAKWGAPYFYQEKIFDRPDHCYWCYFKPFILHDGFVYPCSSVVLHSGAEGRFNDQFRWVRMEDLPDIYKEEMAPFPTKDCDHCVFKEQNDSVGMILNPQMENFI